MTTIVTKNGSGAPLASDLVQGELAVDLTNKRLYTEDSGGTVIEVGTNPSTIDINAGTIDGTVIGGASAAAGTFTTFTSTGIDDNATSTAITIDASQNVGIGTTSTSGLKLNVLTEDSDNLVARFENSHATGSYGIAVKAGDDSGNYCADFANKSGTSLMRIRGDGNVGIGTSSPQKPLHISGPSGGDAGISFTNSISGESSTDGLLVTLNSDGTNATFWNYENGYMRFATNSTERMRIDSSGNLLVGKTALGVGTPGIELRESGIGIFTVDADTPVYVNRESNDGDLIVFRQNNVTEGTISVSGTTVSYNGGHLSRWSQSDIDDVSTIYKGTVMSNLDEMCDWDKEDNEQLNKTKVSDVEGDVNVAGVFVAEDNSDDLSDYYLAMTGDMIIRIAQGTTVQRGDLLMSAGDGTAKPQDDDIVRSKTIAKVTSTNVTCTYADGSYCVPCVLMAC